MPAGTVRSSNKTSQQVILQFPQAVPMQPLVPVLRLQFSYKLKEGLDGFYRSSYIGETPDSSRQQQTAADSSRQQQTATTPVAGS